MLLLVEEYTSIHKSEIKVQSTLISAKQTCPYCA